MKKALSLFVLLLFLLSFPVSAASGRLTAAAVSGKVGEQVTVTVRLDNPGIIATRIFVRYDSAVLQLDGAENGEIFEKSHAVFGKDMHADPYTLLWDDSLRSDNITTSGTLCTLRFTIRKAAADGETSIRIAVDKASTFDVDLNEVTIADATCTVKTAGSPAASGSTASVSAADTAKPAAGTAAEKTSPTSRPAASTAAEKPSAASRPITAASAAADKSTAARTAASSAASAAASSAVTASSQSTPKEESGTTAAAQTIPDIGTTAAPENAAADSSLPAEKSDVFTQADPSDASDESGVLTIGAAEKSETRRVNLLWLLVLVPVAAVLLFAIFKKKK